MYHIANTIPCLLQSAKPDYAALNLHCCRDTCHVGLGGKGNAWLEVFFFFFRHTLHASFPRGVKVEAEGRNSGDKAALPTAPEASRLPPSLSPSVKYPL